VWAKSVWFGTNHLFFSFFFFLFSLIFMHAPSKSQRNPSIFNPFGFDSCSFDYYLFFLE
jgi:hypothetical protein